MLIFTNLETNLIFNFTDYISKIYILLKQQSIFFMSCFDNFINIKIRIE